jgi:hypothetical protein
VKRIQTGVYYCASADADLLFITLEKSEKDYSPTTLYNERTSNGRRYVQATRDGAGKGRVLLFVRARKSDERGETMPYTLLGRAFYLEHHGGRPMQVQWELETAMPAALYQETKVAAG